MGERKRRRAVGVPAAKTDDDWNDGDVTSLEKGSAELRARELAAEGLDADEQGRAMRMDAVGGLEGATDGHDERVAESRERQQWLADEPTRLEDASENAREDVRLDQDSSAMRAQAELEETLAKVEANERERARERENWVPTRARFSDD